jgi:hypothetical protein
MRKSTPREQNVQGNAEKFDAYREAWTRIRQAQENEFFLEAITIQESIISDRLVSFLSRPGASNSFVKAREKSKFASFYQLIQAWQEEFPDGIKYPKFANENLIEKVDLWRRSRNDAIHAIVKSEPGTPTKPIDEFLETAKKVAEIGTELAEAICIWQKGEKRKQNSSSASV